MRRPAYLAVAVALTAALTGLPSVPSFASSTASTGLSTASSTGRTAAPASGASSSPGTSGAGAAAGSASAAPRTSVVLDSYMPVASPGVPLSLSGHVDLAPPDPGQDLVVEARVVTGGVKNRAGLERVRANPTSVKYDYPLSNPVPVEPDHTFTFDAQPELTKPQLTIYPMRIAVYKSVNGQPGSLIAAAYTFLVWAPKPATATATANTAPTYITTVLPIAALPKLRSDWMLTDNTLAGDIKGPNGRLFRLLEAVKPTSGQQSAVALALDPTLLRALQVMAGENAEAKAATKCTIVPAPCYRFASPKGPQERPANADTDAHTFLEKLRAFADTPGNIVFALPWGDADLTALLRADEGGDANWAVKTGQVVVADALGHKNADGLATVAYPGDGFADSATLAFLADPKNGMSTVILDDRQLPVSSSSPVKTPTALTTQQTPAGPIHALAADSKLADLVEAPRPDGTGPGEWQTYGDVLAELAMITVERQVLGRKSALAVLALPRDWDPPAGWASLLLGNDTFGSPSSADTTFQQLFQPVALPVDKAGAADAAGMVGGPTGATAATTTEAGMARGGLVYPEFAAAREIPTSYVKAVEELRGEADLLGPVLCSKKAPELGPAGITTTPPDKCDQYQAVVKPMKDTLLTALSVRWRGDDRTGAVRLSQEVDGRIGLIRGSIRVVASSKVTLTSRDGTVPLTVNNISDTHEGNAFSMTVVLRLSSNDKTRLRSASKISVTVQPHGVAQEAISVSSDSAGSFPVYIQVLTPDGQRLTTPPAPILVRSTAYGTIATAITYVAVGLFAAAVLLRLVRRRRRRGAGPHGGDGPGEPLAGGPPIGEPPTMADGTRTDPDAAQVTDRVTTPVRRIQANAAGTQRTQSERAYAGGVPANPSEP
ncbi:DUF6049 family protein [Pseudofrankia sp. BMG5.37]|uniref:DUF6049 family protein n=1 Tax=Pseudofrankia sp. BMG5.37 TaxID=3050035 RepID=UPI0028949988|nr:DUF6049 family protein [Pseudofrankia sp. BMG5.37]MDT3444126.1 DUF6049 family protein [Pseudofrankia sp. BMG5.37]